MKVRVGTRGSRLALRQTEFCLSLLRGVEPALQFEIVVIKTTGDRVQGWPLFQLGGKGVFVREIEEALLRGEIDMAVHSMKDLPTALPPGLVIGAVPQREDPRDALISKDGVPWEELPQGAVVGTSSLRRMVQLRRLMPQALVKPIRGNLDTRLRKLGEGYDAIVVALSGLLRLGVTVGYQVLGEDQMLPAPGQGALAIECREDWLLREVLVSVHHEQSAREVLCERAFLREMGGGCQVPIAARARCREGKIEIRGMVASVDGERVVEGVATGDDPEAVGKGLASLLMAQGAREIMEEIHGGEGLFRPL